MSLPWIREYPAVSADVVLDIMAYIPENETLTLENALRIQLPRVWLSGRQMLCLSRTSEGRIRVEVVASDQGSGQ